ncbi:MAG: (4Fe-4S)-binding protein, partial [Candidatus Mariimomonas ferrooxydans]
MSEECNECGLCSPVCQGSADPDKKQGWRSAECMYCWNCDDICPQNAVSFGFLKKTAGAGMDLGRRRVITAMLSGVVAVPLLRVAPLSKSNVLTPLLHTTSTITH